MERDKFDEENIRSIYLRQWLNLLCDTEPRYEKFIDQFMDDGNMFHSACKYQKYLREEEGRGTDIKLDHIEKAIEAGDLNSLNVILQELFIEPIDDREIDYFVNLVEKEEISAGEIYNLHKNDRDKGFWLTLKKMM
jgi:hypothetical protein